MKVRNNAYLMKTRQLLGFWMKQIGSW
uniref:Uncharacterized protein n=1 Tax=Rhizophora mucronata TaxID=61149 RepID=A0A2P2QI27_RHIMU